MAVNACDMTFLFGKTIIFTRNLLFAGFLLISCKTPAMLKLSDTSYKSTVLPIDLKSEIKSSFVAGGRVVIFFDENGTVKAKRKLDPVTCLQEEMAIRKESWLVFQKINLAKGSNCITPSQVQMFEKFAITNYGAIWIREVVNENIQVFNKGYLEINKDALDLLKSGKELSFSALITGELSDEGCFELYPYPLIIRSDYGYGAHAQPGVIELGHKGFREYFPNTGEKVDPMAIISHEFGHTRFGDPLSGKTPEGETATVRNYENPVRIYNGYQSRKCYHYSLTNKTIIVETDKMVDGVPDICSKKK